MMIYNPEKYLPLTFLTIVNICFLIRVVHSEITASPKVTIRQGTLQGITLLTNHERNVSGFLGIPYAQPPIENLRFASPIAADGWNGTRDATFDRDICPQILENKVVGEEDCLYLNVYTPQLPDGTKISLLPVMVYIHGGRFARGDPGVHMHGPGYLLDEDVVLVVMKYRLGPLGFLSTGDEIASGNWALKDQVLALEWVQQNIHYFGGNPDEVTLFGVSAGSVCVHLLALSDSAIGLFHRYILESGSALGTWSHQPRTTYAHRAFELGGYVGCNNDTSESLIECLRAVNYTDILAMELKFLVWGKFPTIVWTPTDELDIEGAIIRDSPANLMANGSMHDLPWISGVVRDEGLMHSVEFYEDEKMFEDFLENIDLVLPHMLSLTHQSDSGAAWVSAIKSYYFNNDLTTNRSLLLSNLTRLVSDALFYYPAYNALQQQFNLAESSEYFYTFNYRGTYSKTQSYGGSTVNYGVTHGDDTLYLFPSDALLENAIRADFEMVDSMVQLWTSFAINGTPKALAINGTDEWEQYSTKDNYLRIGNGSELASGVEHSFFTERMQFWTDLTNTPVTAAAMKFYSNFYFIFVLICGRLLLFAGMLA